MPFVTRAFFERPLLTVARDMVGCTLAWDGCGGTIVEVEAYAAEGDPACHTMTRPSAREFVARNPPGAAYVYLNYGMYWLLNVLVKGGGEDGLILFRALEPTMGVPLMRERRNRSRLEDLCSGPGKLGRALAVTRDDHGHALAGRPSARTGGQGVRGLLPRSNRRLLELVEDGRIGISQAADRPWRFSLRGNPYVSVRPRG
ncbi:MAG: DNA-3-methyladenine glycosylase [Verrucomicrobiales bacterium]